MNFKRTLWLFLIAIAGTLTWIILSSTAKPKSYPIADSSSTSSSLATTQKGDVVAEQYGAVICPDSKAFDAFDAASIRAFSTNHPSDSASKPDPAGIWLNTAKPNGCNYIPPGTSLISEGETSNSGGGGPLAIVTAKMPDGTTTKGVTFPTMIYSIPKGNVVANDLGTIICPGSKDIERY